MKKKKDNIKLIDIRKIRFAIEIEAEVRNEKLSDKIITRNRTLKGWNLTYDGSLENGLEIAPTNSNKLYYNDDSLMQIKEVLALLRLYRAKVSKRCGLHIHVNARNLTDAQVLTVIKEWAARQRFIVKKFKVNKERLESTCQLIPKEEIKKLTEKEIHQFRTRDGYEFLRFDYLNSKYHSLNCTHLAKGGYGSLEFRLFDGSLNFKEIKSAVYFVLNFFKESLERE